MNEEDLKDAFGAFQDVIENMMASHALMQAQVEVLEAKLVSVLEYLEWPTTTHESLADSLYQETIDHCNQKLARIADDQPGMASKMKTLVDEMISNRAEPPQ